MPYLKIESNLPIPPETRSALLRQLSRDVAEILGKPERYVMVSIAPHSEMLFAGEDGPTAYLELKSIGLPQARTAEISRRLCERVGESLGIDPQRIYIEFADAPRAMWGWNGGTF